MDSAQFPGIVVSGAQSWAAAGTPLKGWCHGPVKHFAMWVGIWWVEAPTRAAPDQEAATVSTAPSPSAMTATERLDEIGQILAAGIGRLRVKRLESQARSMPKKRECSLDLPVKESGHVRTKTRRGETE